MNNKEELELELFYKNKGNEHFKKGDFQKAMKFYSKAIEINSNNYLLYSNRSITFFYLNKWEESIKDANKAIEINSSWIKVLNKMFIFFIIIYYRVIIIKENHYIF